MENLEASALLKRGQDMLFAQPPDLGGASKSFRCVTECAPNWAEGFLWLGTVLYNRKELEDAVKNF